MNRFGKTMVYLAIALLVLLAVLWIAGSPQAAMSPQATVSPEDKAREEAKNCMQVEALRSIERGVADNEQIRMDAALHCGQVLDKLEEIRSVRK